MVLAGTDRQNHVCVVFSFCFSFIIVKNRRRIASSPAPGGKIEIKNMTFF